MKRIATVLLVLAVLGLGTVVLVLAQRPTADALARCETKLKDIRRQLRQEREIHEAFYEDYLKLAPANREPGALSQADFEDLLEAKDRQREVLESVVRKIADWAQRNGLNLRSRPGEELDMDTEEYLAYHNALSDR